MELNRRGFLSSLAGVVAWGKSKLSLSPAARAVPPACEKPYQYEVRFLARDGRTVEPSPVLRCTKIDQATNTMWLDSVIPSDVVGRVIVVSKSNCPDSPYFQIGACDEYLGLKRSA